MKLHTTPLSGLFVATTTPHQDTRGSFARLFCQETLKEALQNRKIVQINHSLTKNLGAVRGLHFQRPPFMEMKMVRCIKGRAFDVAVDLRSGSPTFLHHYSCELSADNHRMMIIPEGFAHGFQTLTTDCEMLYLHTEFYHKESEGGLRFDDPRLSIEWPLPATDLSDKDRHHPLLNDNFKGITR